MKIKKIDIPESTAIDTGVLWGGINDNVLAAKINELIDVVNKQQDIIRQIGEWGSSKGECLWCDTLTEFNPEKPLKETFVSIDEALKMGKKVDPYAEQRKWIGKLCRFWDDSDEPENCVYGVLCNIFDLHHEDCPFQCDGNGEWYEYCEPVKPDSELIYHGE